ncbi:MAG: hypothetical protein ACRDZ3_14960 [Acidimicrobiia bacterium]
MRRRSLWHRDPEGPEAKASPAGPGHFDRLLHDLPPGFEETGRSLGDIVRRARHLSGLRVAVLAPISWRVPPRHYGPWEQFASLLTEGLTARGVDVTLFATADSLTTARLSATAARGWSEDPTVDPKAAECLHIAALFERAGDFDLIHNSFDFLPLTYSALVPTPMVTTIHGFSSPAILPVYERYNRHGAYVAISDADRHPRLEYLCTSTTGSTRMRSRSGPGAVGTCCSSDGSIRTRAPRWRSRWPAGWDSPW